MANANLASMSVDALLKLREDLGEVLTRRTHQLRDQLARLGREVSPRTHVSSLKGRSVPVGSTACLVARKIKERSKAGRLSSS
jgi:hypothetical protein